MMLMIRFHAGRRNVTCRGPWYASHTEGGSLRYTGRFCSMTDSSFGVLARLVLTIAAWMVLTGAAAGGMADAAGKPSAPAEEGKCMKYAWLSSARFISWHLSKFWSLEDARKEAKKLKATGANTVITFGYHYRFQHVDEWPQIEESLKNVVTACHEEGLRVIEHHSATFVPPEQLKFVVDGVSLTDCTVKDARDGKAAYFDDYKIIMLCCNNPKFRKIYFNYVLKLVKDTGVDALMSDDIEFCPTWYVCGCEYCRAKFRQWAGEELPDGASPKWGDFNDPWFRQWLRFRMKSVGDYYVDLRKAMDDAGVNIPLLGCLAGASNLLLSQNWGMTGEEFARGVDLNFYEAYFGASNFDLWRHLGAEIRYYQGIGRRFGQPLFTLGYTRSEDDLFFMWAFNLLMGDRLWLNSIPEHPAKTFRWEAARQDLFQCPESMANIALLFSRQTRDVYGGNSETFYLDEWRGWPEMLLEANVPYDTILDADLTGDLSRYRLLILPEAACLSDAQVAGIRRFVKQGGRVIATHELAFFDETGARRGKPALADLTSAPPEGFVYHEAKVGAGQLYPIPELESGQTETKWQDTRDKAMRQKLLGEVRTAAEPLPWRVAEGGTGVLASVYRVKNGVLVAHLLNVAPLDLGEHAVICKDRRINYSPTSLPGPVTLEIQTKDVKSATLLSPDNAEPLLLKVSQADGVWRVRVGADQIRRYGVIRIETGE